MPPVLVLQIFESRVNGQHVSPPSTTTRFVVRDMGNASPRLLRSSLNAVPATNDMLNTSGMQFSLALQPLALLDPDDDQIQVSAWPCVRILICGHDRSATNVNSIVAQKLAVICVQQEDTLYTFTGCQDIICLVTFLKACSTHYIVQHSHNLCAPSLHLPACGPWGAWPCALWTLQGLYEPLHALDRWWQGICLQLLWSHQCLS